MTRPPGDQSANTIPSQDPEAILQALSGAGLKRFPRKIDLGLDRILAVLSRLGDPHLRLPPVVHVAGTNGKGSTVAMVRAMLEAAGQRVHVYTSPHLVRLTERYVVAGQEIAPADLAAALARVAEAAGEAPLTEFEIMTAAAFVEFADTDADYTLLEVGLGGRLDATNVIRPHLSVITPISLDHQAFLGESLAEIAGEKAGILRPEVPAIIGPQDPEVMAVILARAEALGTPLTLWGQDYQGYESMGRLVLETPDAVMDLPLPVLAGRHQIQNASVAAMTAHALEVCEPEIVIGLGQAQWPGRLQRLGAGPYTAAAAGAEVWLDGCHNASGSQATAEFFAELNARDPRPLTVVMGMLANRSPRDLMAPFAGLARQVIHVPVPGAECVSAKAMQDTGQALSLPVSSAQTVLDAIKIASTQGTGRIAIVGSLYLVGAILAAHHMPFKA